MTRFEMFVALFEPAHGWRNEEDARAAFDAWAAADLHATLAYIKLIREAG